MLYPEAPWKLSGGGLIRNASLLVALSRRFDVHVFTADSDAPEPDARFAGCIAEHVRFPSGPRAHGVGARLLAAVRSRTSLLTAGFAPPAYEREARRRIASGDYAAVQFDLHFLPIVRAARGATPLVFNAHNCESLLHARRAELESPLTAVGLRLDAMRVRALEREALRRSALALICSEDDRRDLAAIDPIVNRIGALVPNGIDTAMYRPLLEKTPQAGRILISGSIAWRPNRLGVQWFLQEVWPRLRERMGSLPVELHIAGRMPQALAVAFGAIPGVVATPNPLDMRDELAQAQVVIAPVLAASGTRLRILEAWAAGRPVVTTTAGASGLSYANGEELMAVDDPTAQAEAIASLLHNPVRYERMRESALRRVREYDWDAVAEATLAAYARLSQL